jgi:hypothetical protein
MGFAAGGELGGLTVEARQFGLQMQMAKIKVAENPAAYISFMPPKSAMDGRFRRNHSSFLCNPVSPRAETYSPQGNTGGHRGRGIIGQEGRRALSRSTFLTLMFIDVLLQGADPALLLTQH